MFALLRCVFPMARHLRGQTKGGTWLSLMCPSILSKVNASVSSVNKLRDYAGRKMYISP